MYLANALLNRRPVKSLKKYLPADARTPSRDDLYFGLEPSGLEPTLEAAIGPHLDPMKRAEQRQMYEDIVAEYDRDMARELKERNDKVLVTHELKVGDYCLVRNEKCTIFLGGT